MGYSEALEQQVALLRYLESGEGRRKELSDDDIVFNSPEADRRVCADATLDMLRDAVPFYWSPSICKIIESSAQGMPDWVLSEDSLIVPCGFFWFAQPLHLPHGEFPARNLTGFSWWYGRDTSSVFFRTYLEDTDRMAGTPASAGVWKLGQSHVTLSRMADQHVSNDLVKARMQCPLAFMAASLAFIQQRILVTPQHRAERHAVKRLERDGWTHEPLIRVVELRRKANQHQKSDDPATVAWSHQWVVSGHWHNYWVGPVDKQILQPRWLMPYVKGPEDRPLKPPRAKVFAVIR